MGERSSYTPGTFSWAELATPDQEDAKRFYGGLFGWEMEDNPIGEGAEDRFEVREEVVHRPDRRARAAGDAVHRDAGDALLRDELGGGVEDGIDAALTALLEGAARGAVGGRGRGAHVD